MPTDTIYGLAGQALSPQAVEKAYDLKGRTPDKPFIILIAGIEDLALFDIKLDPKTKAFLKKTWPNPVSVILSCPGEKFAYLHRGTKSLAFRVPKDKNLRQLLTQTGPLFASSANLQDHFPAQTIAEAKRYFGKQADFYIDRGKLSSPPSTLIKIENQKIKILRPGSFPVNIWVLQETDEGKNNKPVRK